MRPVLNLDEYRLLFKANPQPMWIFDVETLAFVAVNDAAVRLYGYTEQEFLSMTIKDIRASEDVPLLLAKLPEPPKGLGETDVWRHRKKDGTVIDVELATQQFTLSGRVVRYVLIHDITEKKRALNALRDSQERLQRAVSTARLVAWELDVATHQVWVTQSVEQVAGVSVNQFFSQSFNILHPDDVSRHEETVRRTVETGGSYHTTFRIIRPDDGSVVWMEEWAQAVCDAEGRTKKMIGVAMDITERMLAEEEIRFQARLLEAVQQGVIASDLEGKILYWNRFAESLYGWSADEVLGKDITDITPSSGSRKVAVAIMSRLRQGENWSGEFELQRRDGTTFPAMVTVSSVYDQKGKIIGIIGVSADITERHQAEAERRDLLRREQEARAEAETANRLKDEFLAVLSHELRTPLNAILGWADILQKGNLDPDLVSRAVEVIQRSAQTQSRIIEDLVDLSRIIGGKLHIDFVAVQFVPVIEAAIDMVRPLADAKRLHVEKDFRSPEATVSGDPTRLQQVVWNLLSNAVKFTPEGGKLSIRLKQSGSDVVITVSDTGKGIPAEFLPHIFERFSQAEGGSTGRHSGLGLGLAIVRHLVELHHGTVSAYSAGEGQGSTFTVTLPLISVSQETV